MAGKLTVIRMRSELAIEHVIKPVRFYNRTGASVNRSGVLIVKVELISGRYTAPSVSKIKELVFAILIIGDDITHSLVFRQIE